MWTRLPEASSMSLGDTIPIVVIPHKVKDHQVTDPHSVDSHTMPEKGKFDTCMHHQGVPFLCLAEQQVSQCPLM